MKRIKYFDLLRIVCFVFITFYHMMIQLYIDGIYPSEKLSPFFSNANMHIATLAVAVFFMLSGASLAYTTKEKFDLINFYKKRFIRLLIPFYIVIVSCAIVAAIIVPNFMNHFAGVPKWRFIFTVLGLDGWVSMHNIATFSIRIGEWFLGALVILYVLFPLFRFLMLKNSKVFFGTATLVYLIVVYTYSSNVPVYMSLCLKGYEFILGMLFGFYANRFNYKWMVITVPIVIFFFISPISIAINEALKITVLAVAFFVSFSYLENVLNDYIYKPILVLSKYTYELFLVHHAVIFFVTPRAARYITGKTTVAILFLVELCIIAVITVLLKWISDKMISFVLQLTEKQYNIKK